MKNQGFGNLLKRPERLARHRFVTDQDGAMWPLMLPLFLCMVSVALISIDILTNEVRRGELQQTLDRATLAAASLTNTQNPTTVVNDYFAKSRLSSQLKNVTVVTDNFGYRKVTASAAADIGTLQIGASSGGKTTVRSVSAAEQRMDNVEIALVLDISGSMNSNNRLTNLKTAAKDFVTTVLDSATDNKTTITIVPFNGQVNLGATLAARYNVVDRNSEPGVECVDLPASVYSGTGISPSLALSNTAHADTYSGTGTTAPSAANRWCPPSTTNIVRLPSTSKTTLNANIDALTAIGATSINAGMKWGLTLLDPGTQPVFSQLISQGQIASSVQGRPFSYAYEDGMKVIVLMTDGEHFAEERVNPAYKTGNSTVWRSNSDGRDSVFHSSRVNSSTSTNLCNSRPFYVPHLNAWHSRPWNGTTPLGTACYVPAASYSGSTVRSWPDVWRTYNMQWLVWNYYAIPLGSPTGTQNSQFSTWLGTMRSQTPTSTMDSQLQGICNLAKSNGVMVYGIAFEAPAGGQTQISQCATSPAHYYNAAGLQIRTAFKSIANNISQLRLTQ